MTDNTKPDLLERVLIRLPWLEYVEPVTFNDGSGGDAINIFHMKSIMKLCVESDDAREYWRGQDYDIQERAVQLAVLVERTRFVEQACDAVYEALSGQSLNETAIRLAQQAIRDRFKTSESS